MKVELNVLIRFGVDHAFGVREFLAEKEGEAFVFFFVLFLFEISINVR